MRNAEQAPVDRLDTLAIPLACASAWSGAIGEVMRASTSSWLVMAKTYRQVNKAYAVFLGQAMDLEGVGMLALTDSADWWLRNELRALEDGSEHFAYVAEETLAHVAGAPLIPLPD